MLLLPIRTAVRVLAACLLLLAVCAPAQARSWRISNFESRIVVTPDARLLVTERLDLVFVGQWNGIYRTIPIEYPGPRGSNYMLLLDVRSVTEGAGAPLKYESYTTGPYRELKIFIPGAVDTTRTIEITYAVRNGIRFFESHDELYWNVTGNDWEVPIDHASALVTFPEGANGLRAQAFTGYYGSAERDANAEVVGTTAHFATKNPLPMRSGLTIDVFIPKGVLEEPSALTRAWWFLRGNLIILLPLLAFVVMFTLWHYKGRDPDAGLSVAPMYEPPKDMSPSEVGALADDRVDNRDITAILVDLAVHGYIRIDEIKDEGFFWDSTDYELHLLKDDHAQLKPYEARMLREVFSGGAKQVKISSLANRFYTAMPKLRKDIMEQLKAQGMYHVDPNAANGYRMLGVVLIALPFVLLEYTGVANLFASPLIAAGSIVLALLIVWLIGRHLTAKTIHGVKTWTHVRGFEEFIARVETDRLRRMPPDTFEKFLPFAMALGLEQRWAKAFAEIGTQPPNWYRSSSHGMFNPVHFTRGISSMSDHAAKAFVAAPRSHSGGSGFGGGGGGFSGGGFGGGGGRGF